MNEKNDTSGTDVSEQLPDRPVVPPADPRQQVERLRAVRVQFPLLFTCRNCGRSTVERDYSRFPVHREEFLQVPG